jgi:hypothetical protein
MPARLLDLDPSTWTSHSLHAPDRDWVETNCYIDVWVEALHALGLEPLAALPFTVAQDFEGDHFTFFKFPPEDLRALFGLAVQELAIFDTVEGHIEQQLQRGRMVLVEVDAFHLPDTKGTSYGRAHTKTTVAAVEIDIARKLLGYFHNTAFHRLEGADFDGVFQRAPETLFPYCEFVKRESAPFTGRALVDRSLALLRTHLRRRPADPIAAFRAEFPTHIEILATRSMDYFHQYAFNVPRQLGANFEMLGSYLRWLADNGERDLGGAISACQTVSAACKALQFQLARAVNRKKFGDYEALLDTLATSYKFALTPLVESYA